MRRQPLASEILDRLYNSNLLDTKDFNTIKQWIRDGDEIEAFRKTYKLMVKQGWHIGWNKVWRGNDIIGWYGRIVTVQSLRSATMEVEAEDVKWNDAKHWLCSLDECKPHKNTDKIHGLLATFGLDPRIKRTDKNRLRVLHRLNLDMHDCPFIERWRWSGGIGTAYLSDEGRFQVTRELVWARAVETGLQTANVLTLPLKTFLERIYKTKREALLPECLDDTGLMACLDRLEFFGLCQKLVDCVLFSVQPGGFPELAVGLWGD